MSGNEDAKEDAKTMVVKMLSNWVKWTQDDVFRLMISVSRRRYSKTRIIAAKNVRNPLLRCVLKIFDKALHIIVRRLEKKIRELKKDINRTGEAIIALQNNNPEPAIDILGERLLIFSSLSPNIGLGDSPSVTDNSMFVFYTNLVHDLRKQTGACSLSAGRTVMRTKL